MDYKIFWCKVNKYYLNRWLEHFSRKESVTQKANEESTKQILDSSDFPQNNSPLIIATCVVTDRAKSKRIKTAKQALKQWRKVYLTGCGAFDRGKKITEDKFYRAYPDLLQYQNHIILLWEDPDSKTTRETKKHQFKQGVNIYTKKFIVIQNGCDSYCTFCLTVQKRGKHKTIPFAEIVDQINDFSAIGGKEVVLTGINLSAWGNTSTNEWQDNQFGKMLKKLLQETDIPRIRISSLGPEFLDDHFFQAIQNPRFLPHFHFSIQSFDTNVLKNMKRHYDYLHLKNILTNIRQLKQSRNPQIPISIGADIITSFPWETEEQFQTTLQAIEDFQITKLHAFPFSPHRRWDKVPAGFFDNQIDDPTKKLRQQKIIKLGNSIRKDFIKKNIWITQNILLEEQKNWYWYGRTENYIGVKIPIKQWNFQRGDIVSLPIEQRHCTEW